MAWNVWEKLRNITWTRNRNGTNTYVVGKNDANWSDYSKLSNLKIAQNHPILTPALLFVSKLFSQAQFMVVNEETGKEEKNHWLSKLLKNPNIYQTQNDFLESLQFIQIAQGKAVGYLKRGVGFSENEDIESIYILDSDKIKWPSNYTSNFVASQSNKNVGNQEVTYDPDGENLMIKISDLLFFYDLPNALNENFYEVRSRLDGLKQTLINTQDSLVAKNIILKTNGKEILSSGTNDNFPLAGDDKKQAESLLQNNYGLGWNRKRGIVTSASVTYQSMHIALRDLGLDESIKVDGNIIYTALHIPKDIISLEAKKTTYNNFKESMVSYVQNEMQASLNSFIEVLQRLIKDSGLKIVGTYDHLPIMQFILKEKWEGQKVRAEALKSYLDAGMPSDIALEILGLDPNIKLEKNETKPKGTETGSEDNE